MLRDQVSGVVCSSPWLTLTKVSADAPRGSDEGHWLNRRYSRPCLPFSPPLQHQPPPGLITALAPTLLRFFPNLKYPAPLRAQDLTRDVAVQEAWKKDPLISGWVHAKSAWGPLTGGPKIVSDEYKYWPAELPLLIAHGEDDNVTDPKGSKQLVENLKANGARDVEFKGFPDGRHEMMFEIDDVKSQVRWEAPLRLRPVSIYADKNVVILVNFYSSPTPSSIGSMPELAARRRRHSRRRRPTVQRRLQCLLRLRRRSLKSKSKREMTPPRGRRSSDCKRFPPALPES